MVDPRREASPAWQRHGSHYHAPNDTSETGTSAPPRRPLQPLGERRRLCELSHILGGGWSCLACWRRRPLDDAILVGSQSQEGSAAHGTTRSPVAQISPALRQRESAALERLQKPQPHRPCPRTIVDSTPGVHQGGRRGDEHAPGSVAVGATADGTISASPRRANSASALSMIESVSFSSPSAAPPEATRQVHRRILHRRGRGGACCGGQGADDQDGVDGDVLDGERVEQCADGSAPSKTTAPGSQASQAQASQSHAAEPTGVPAA